MKKQGHQTHFDKTKKTAIKDLVGQMKIMTKEEKTKLMELMKEERKTNSLKEEPDNKKTSVPIRAILSKLYKQEREKLLKKDEEEGLIVPKEITNVKVPSTGTEKSTAKNFMDKMKAMMKDEKVKFDEWMRGTEESDLSEKETASSVSPSLDVYSVTATIDSQSINIPITISIDAKDAVETDSLLDSGAGGVFIDQNYARQLHLDIKMLDTPVKARNVDGTENKRGTIKSYVDLQFNIGDKGFTERFYLTGLGKQTMILGFPWLKKHNPLVDWQTGRIDWRDEEKDDFVDEQIAKFKTLLSKSEEKDTRIDPKPSMEEEEDHEIWKNRTLNPIDEEKDDEIWSLILKR